MLYLQLCNYEYYNFFFVCSECLYGGAGMNVQLSPAAFPALWGCCQKWSIHIFVLHIWKEDAGTRFNFSWECAMSYASAHGVPSFYRDRGCLSFPYTSSALYEQQLPEVTCLV